MRRRVTIPVARDGRGDSLIEVESFIGLAWIQGRQKRDGCFGRDRPSNRPASDDAVANQAGQGGLIDGRSAGTQAAFANVFGRRRLPRREIWSRGGQAACGWRASRPDFHRLPYAGCGPRANGEPE